MPIHVHTRDLCQAQLHRPSRDIRHIRPHQLNHPRPHLAGPHGDGDSEPVSPVSDTHSISASRSYAKDNDGEFHVGGDLQIPRPIGKTQPSWDPFTGTPLFEEDGFEMGLSRDPSPHAPPTVYQATYAPQAAKARAATSVPRNNALDDQHDDWVVVSPQSPPSGQVQVVSPQSPPQPLRSFQPTDSSREILENEDGETPAISHPIQLHPQQSQQPQQQTIQHLPSQQQAASPQRNSSFVGLPPIRRSSTFGINLTKRAKKRFSLDEDEDDHFVPSPVGTTTDQYGGRGGTSSSRLQQEDPGWPTQPTRIDTAPSSSRKDIGMSQNVFSATSTQAATLATDSTGVTGADWRIDDEKRPLAPGAAFKGAGHVPGPIDTGAAMQSDGRMNGPPYGPGMRPQQGMMSPTFGGGGNPIHHLPPQGPWKLEESHLSEPLAASRNRQSGGSLSPQQQSFFGYEKEMGVPPPAAPRPETQLPPRQKFSEVPPSSAQRYPGLFSPPQREQNPGSPTGPRTSRDLGQQYYGRDSTSLYRTQTGDSDVSTFDPSVDEERGRSRRSSGFFKEIGGRFSRESSRRRPASKAAEAAPGDPVGPVSPDVRGGEVSEASVATREFQDRQRRRSSFFLNLRGSRPSDAGVPQSGDREGITQSPKPSPNPGVSPPVQQPASFADRKRLFLGPPGNELSPALPNSSLSRSSTSTVGNDAAGGVVGPPKKRFSGFTSKVFSRTSSQQDLQIPQKPGTSHSATSSMLGRPPGTPVNQPGPSQQCHALAEQGAQPWLGVENDDRAASFQSRTETQDPSVLRQKSGQLLDRASQPVPAPSAPVTQAQREQDSPEPRHGNEQRQILSSAQLPQGQLLQSNDQNQDHWVPQGFSAEPTPEPSIRHGMEREQAPGSHAPPLAQSHSGNAHALGIHGPGHAERILDQSAPLLSPSGARAKSPNGGPASQSGISQHSSTSTSPQPTVASQMQPPVNAPVLDSQTPLPGSSLVSPPIVHSSDHPNNPSPDNRSRNSNKCRIQVRHNAPRHSRGSRGRHPPGRSLNETFTRHMGIIPCTNSSVNLPHQWGRLISDLSLSTMYPVGALVVQGFVEPRYDQVPIPQGYAAVHGEGGVAPSPYAISRASPPGQFPPYQVPPVQHWSPPSAAQRHPSEVSLYSQPSSTVSHGQHSLQGYRHPNAMSEGGRRISMASHQSNMSHTSHNTQPGISGPNGSPPVFGQQHQQQDPTGLRIVNDDGGSQGAAPTLQVGQQDPPSSQQAHQQRSSSIKAAAPYVASPQVHQTRNDDAEGQISSNNGGQPISQTAVSLQSEAQTQTRGLAAGSGSVTGGNSRSASPGTQVAGGSNISPEPQAPATSRLSVNLQMANQETPDDIYDSTPRLSTGLPPPPAKPVVSTATGQSMVSDSSADEAPRNATHVNGNANGAASTTLASGKSTRAELEDTEDERKRSIRHEAQEEKILVDPYEELQSGGIKYRKEEDPEVPQMSATSYPGQEWNPYGAGGYEDWD
ncbi:hypothetical protein CH063_07535 [Colletotrichum higginsianum]|uniref:Uncharacterized protein n=1 Tax=Colletotrichum higginsianum (strain IMI 349063) TaxID=759273 RepID=H1V6I5_COLHI|nr:hypothetical protein CH063_07535 [Colletotrichum higginsianum]